MNSHDQFKEIDTQELKFVDTIFIRDIETLLGREGNERIKGIYVEQDQKNHSVSIKIEVNVAHGVSLPSKSDEIQAKIVADVSQLTGLHVSCVHVVFKALIYDEPHCALLENSKNPEKEKSEFSSSEF